MFFFLSYYVPKIIDSVSNDIESMRVFYVLFRPSNEISLNFYFIIKN